MLTAGKEEVKNSVGIEIRQLAARRKKLNPCPIRFLPRSCRRALRPGGGRSKGPTRFRRRTGCGRPCKNVRISAAGHLVRCQPRYRGRAKTTILLSVMGSDGNFSARQGKFDRIVDQVDQHLLHTIRVGIHPGQIGRAIQGQSDPGPFGLDHHPFDCRRDQLAGIDAGLSSAGLCPIRSATVPAAPAPVGSGCRSRFPCAAGNAGLPGDPPARLPVRFLSGLSSEASGVRSS